MKTKEPIYIPHQDRLNEHYPGPNKMANMTGSLLNLTNPDAQYNKLLRSQQRNRNKK